MTVVGGSNKEVPQTPSQETSDKKEKENTFDQVTSSTTVTDKDLLSDAKENATLPYQPKEGFSDIQTIDLNQYSKNALEITAQEKIAFIEAMISGERYTQQFMLFGGRISLTVRSRTSAETHALYAYLRYRLAHRDEHLDVVEGDVAYMPLVSQVEELNGVKFHEMKAPLTYEERDGVDIEPGWLEDFKTWKQRPEGLTSAIISCIQLFEYKYWIMVKEANNKNFWNTDTSIEK